ncbi:MAG: hypothetical protein ABI353_21410 [Isosphaeraceae bacterium]
MDRLIRFARVVFPTFLILAGSAASGAEPPPTLPANWDKLREPAGFWLGQDGRDVVGPSSLLAGSDVQDIHLAIGGLPSGSAVVSGIVTALGGDEWRINGPFGPWRAELVRKPGASTADLFLEPSRVETGRPFRVRLTLDDGRTIELNLGGGRADPNLRMPEAALSVRWIGQGRLDRVGPGPGVGPDGLQDVRLELDRLSPGIEVKGVKVQVASGPSYQSGLNPEGASNAELVRDPKNQKRADLFIQPMQDFAGKAVSVVVAYANGKADAQTITAGRSDPTLRMPRVVLPKVEPLALDARWLGQDGQRPEAPGDVHVSLSGLPPDRPIVAAVLSDSVRESWVYRVHDQVPLSIDPFAPSLQFHRSADGARADLWFAPIRDETGAVMTLRLVFDDGPLAIVRFPGAVCDIDRRAQKSGPGVVKARPGDDLQSLVDQYGTVRLTPGRYDLDRPLVLNRAVTLFGEPGAILRFSQTKDAFPWSAAVKIHAAHTTLEGFAVRFDGPVRWATDTNDGPAVIGSTDNHDAVPNRLKVGLVLRRLDLESPTAASNWEEAPRLIRLTTARSGLVNANILKGGTCEFRDGPWRITDNDYRGTVPHTYTHSVFSVHQTHDLVLKGNTARPVGPSGKTWRFLVMTNTGANDLIEGNRVEGIGPLDLDTMPNQNAPEIILTESYRLHFEGRPAALSADGLILAIPEPQGGPARTGSVVAVLNGPHAGRWYRIAQAINPKTYLMDSPLPTAEADIVIASGFVGETFASNRVDARGSSIAVGLDLIGNHFGTRVLGNHLLGASGFRIAAAPTEQPVHWGWSHAPVFGLVIEGNTLEDAQRGGTLSVEHGPAIKSNAGRVYLSVSLNHTLVRWTDGFLARLASDQGAPKGLTIGEPGALEAGELIVTTRSNLAEGPAGSNRRPRVEVHSATINGQRIERRTFSLPDAAERSKEIKPRNNAKE